uniref:Zinc finger protein RFP-like n=1 Tax=Anolis carolinensis TaxID=28377 RepID=G1KGE3_ANOCA|nr:PREDICTED: zinc finger protein RFP [Anolis carolinensis]|eukprot:XP_008103968.1 PREDICTED: zinc finger protein RFP [Anolis carolinensis]
MTGILPGQDPMKDLCEEVTCSFCLDYFKDPVILDCGHNLCRACLTQRWEKPGHTETSCPYCREIVSQKNLKTNQKLANIVEKVRILNPQGPKKAKGKEGVCGNHQKPLKLFCKDDETPICETCDRSKEHQDHRMIPLGMAAEDYKLLMGHRQDDLVKEREKIVEYKAETEKEAQDLLKQIKTKMETTLDEITEIRQFLDKQETHLQAQMEELKKQITRERDEHFILLSRELSSLENLIQELKERCQQPPAEMLQDVRNLLQRCEEKQVSEKPVAFPPELKWKIWEFCDINSFLVAVMKPFRDALLTGLELQKANVALDPDTACDWLILSEDHKSVRLGDEPQDLPDNPERFSDRVYVLGREGFTSGRHFWEVVVEGEGEWAVGVARESIRRKGAIHSGPKEGIWAVGKWVGMYRAPSIPSSTDFLLSEKTKRVRVCLNYASNQVAFYDADTGDRICIFSDVPFSVETVLPFFYAHKNAYLRILP